MANVLFKRGLQANLPSGNNIVDGALYFTTDSKRLFLGQDNSGTKTLLPIAEGITAVASATSLPTASQQLAGQFYYIAPSGAQGEEAGNILAYCDGSKWLQVNMSTYLTSMSEAVSVDGSGEATVSLSSTLNTGGQGPSASFGIVGDNVTLSVENGKLKLSVADDVNTTYTLGKAASGDDVNLTLTPSNGGTAGTPQIVTLADGVGVDVNIDNNKVVFDVAQNEIALVSSVVGANNSTAGFDITVNTTNAGAPTGTIDPQITYGQSGSQTVHFVGGVATLSVPTIAEMNTKFENELKALNAMRYCGAVATAAAMPTSPSGNAYPNGAFHNGDVYLASQDLTIGSGASAQEVKRGSLIVIQGEEEANGAILPANVTYEIVEGDSTDTTYKGLAITNGIGIANSSSPTANVAQLVVNGSGVISVSESQSKIDSNDPANNKNTLTISHANVSHTTPTATAYSQDLITDDAAFTIVSGVTVNDQGHVTAVTTQDITISSINLGTWSVAAVANSGHTQSTITASTSGSPTQTIEFELASTGSIDITASGDTTTIDVVWGSF